MSKALVRRSVIDAMEDSMRLEEDCVGPEAFELKHHFTGNGLYAREMILPKGTIIIGKIKKDEHISIISAGFVTEMTEAGIQHIKAPYTMVSLPGTKRVVIVHETCVWNTVHKTDETDIDKMVDVLAVNSHDDYTALLEDLE